MWTVTLFITEGPEFGLYPKDKELLIVEMFALRFVLGHLKHH